MATIKSYTSLEQSKKLAEILPIESADMYYPNHSFENYYSPIPHVGKLSAMYDKIPCWSLAALLGVLPFHLVVNNQRYVFSMIKGLDKNGETYAIKYTVFNTTFYLHLTDFYNNPVDACYEMIIKLHEQKLL